MDLRKLMNFKAVRFLALALLLVLAGTFLLPTKAQQTTEEQVWRDPTGLEYVYIQPGEFMMGAVPGDSEAFEEESPRHRVTITRGFWMSRTEVTVRAYRRFCDETGRSMPRAPSFNSNWESINHPIVKVSWHYAVAYCEWAGVRLPTEAEWEYAARGGQEGWIYVWGNDTLPIVNGIKQANVCDEAYKRERNGRSRYIFQGYNDGYAFTSPVGSFAANGFGLYDMAGNVCEWCSDFYSGHYYNRSPERDPQGLSWTIGKVIRGGSWLDFPNSMRVYTRVGASALLRIECWGFPPVRDVD